MIYVAAPIEALTMQTTAANHRSVLALTAHACERPNSERAFADALDALPTLRLSDLDLALEYVVEFYERQIYIHTHRSLRRVGTIAHILVERGAGVIRRVENLLVRALRCDDPELVAAVVDAGGDLSYAVGGAPAIMSAIVEAFSATRDALAGLSPPNVDARLDEDSRETALHRLSAIVDMRARELDLFLDVWGANPTLRDAEGRTPRERMLEAAARADPAGRAVREFRAAAERLADAEQAWFLRHNEQLVVALHSRGLPDELMRGLSEQAGLCLPRKGHL